MSDNKDQFTSYKHTYKLKHYRYDKEYIITSVEKSLKNLKTDYLDTLPLHRTSPLMNFNIIKEALKQVKNHGVSNFSNSQMALASSYFDINLNQIEFSIIQHDSMFNATLDYLQKENIIPIACSPLGTYFSQKKRENNRIKHVLNFLTSKYNASHLSINYYRHEF